MQLYLFGCLNNQIMSYCEWTAMRLLYEHTLVLPPFSLIHLKNIYINNNFKLHLSRSSFICCMAKIICQAVNRHPKSAPHVSIINPVIHEVCYLSRTRSRPWKRSWVQPTQWQDTFLFLYLSFQLFLSGFCLLKGTVFQLISCNRYVNECICLYASNLPPYT